MSTWKRDYWWVSLSVFRIELSGGQPQMYRRLCCTKVKKWFKIAHSLYEAQGRHTQWTFNSLRWLCLQFELTPTQIYDVTLNPRIAKIIIYFLSICPSFTFSKIFELLWWFKHILKRRINYSCVLPRITNCS